MRPFPFLIIPLIVALGVSCNRTQRRPVEATMPVTTDSLMVDILGFKLGERYTEVRVVNTLKPYIDDVKLLSEMKGNDWSNETPYVLRLKDGTIVTERGPGDKVLFHYEGIPWHIIALETSPEGTLYKINLYQDSVKEYDMAPSDSVFHCITERYSRSFGEPFLKSSLPDNTKSTKYFSFKTWRIEENKTISDWTFAEAGWFDGSRELDVGYNDLGGRSHFSLSFEDKTIMKR